MGLGLLTVTNMGKLAGLQKWKGKIQSRAWSWPFGTEGQRWPN